MITDAGCNDRCKFTVIFCHFAQCWSMRICRLIYYYYYCINSLFQYLSFCLDAHRYIYDKRSHIVALTLFWLLNVFAFARNMKYWLDFSSIDLFIQIVLHTQSFIVCFLFFVFSLFFFFWILCVACKMSVSDVRARICQRQRCNRFTLACVSFSCFFFLLFISCCCCCRYCYCCCCCSSIIIIPYSGLIVRVSTHYSHIILFKYLTCFTEVNTNRLVICCHTQTYNTFIYRWTFHMVISMNLECTNWRFHKIHESLILAARFQVSMYIVHVHRTRVEVNIYIYLHIVIDKRCGMNNAKCK